MKAIVSLLFVSTALVSASRGAEFKTDILPIFEARCFRCHANGESKGSFSVDPEEIQKHIRRSGQINPGNADRSILIERLITDDGEDRMPKNGAALSADQIDLIKQWINDGAKIGDGEPSSEGEGDMKKPEPLKGTWTNREGTAIEATLLRVEGANAVLLLGDGRSVPYPIANLSDESQAKVKEFVEASKPAN